MSKAANPSSSSLAIPAVARCVKAHQRAYKLISESFAASGKPVDEFFAQRQAAAAFRDALPPICGEDNIRDFIACVGYALVKTILSPVLCTEYFDAARVALSAVRAERHPPKR